MAEAVRYTCTCHTLFAWLPVAGAMTEHKAQLKELNNKFHWIRTEFQHLEQRISKVSHTAVRTGQQLEAKDLIRRKTDDSKILIRQVT
eukprot:1392751-Amorphochlora_amoeboformis.AAC.1